MARSDGGTVILVIGVQGSGKSWACRKASEFGLNYIPHDRCWKHPDAKPGKGLDVEWGPKGSVSTHFETLTLAARRGAAKGEPVLSEVPFGERKLKERLEAQGVNVIPVFIVDNYELIEGRYMIREGKKPPADVKARAEGLRARAKDWGAFAGTSDEVLEHLKGLGKKDRVA